MLSINTNLSSLIVQSNLKLSTSGLNTAIERMTTGFKINRAKDNAANYAISTKISSKLLSYQAAQDNISMGLDMLTTATDSLELVSSHLSRIRDLAEQAANGTYGDDSLNAIQQEVNSRTAEINRIMANTEYNGISLLKPAGGFIEEINPLTESEAIAQGYTIIKTADDLQALKDNLSGKYILMNDIDLSGYNWTAIGTKTNPFSGELNGNGHVIKNLQVDDAAGNGIGLFGVIDGANVSNVGLENADINVQNAVGILAGAAEASIITNCYSTGSVRGAGWVGGLIGQITNATTINNCFSTANVTGTSSQIGGLVGRLDSSSVSNSYAEGSVLGKIFVGGLIGNSVGISNISFSYALGDVKADDNVGGLLGYLGDHKIYIDNCYSAGTVEANLSSGGMIGWVDDDSDLCVVTNSKVLGKSENLDGIIIGGSGGTSIEVTNCSYISYYKNSGIEAVTTAKPELLKYTGDANCSDVRPFSYGNNKIGYQVGINSSDSSRIDIDFSCGISVNNIDITSEDSLSIIDDLLSKIKEKEAKYGSAYNRLESALESIGVSINNLVSTRSTIRDADIAEESSEYIRNQILQQAAATLMAAANQTPGIVLQLL
ncbi:TPA: hypothetical protein CPT90_01510 [Candidatus Gastranaerophilales bacterium HUM_3]|nr:MAG TPA: hypothetical protein CPT99_05230 [Candidatus Gastranaerophilales bacterium HUM_4]DAA87347.1 MAG TPA: hypothetical protein CPT90_01510 [Candidatus Gastranaerophilales bacterium HUM_3]DAA90042.1 MAG TPA: hypothetical protein CPT87_07835 [Candidatus Gastranaerophilales bacterium HUM_5]